MASVCNTSSHAPTSYASRTLITLKAPLHQQSSPTVRTGVGEHAERFAALCGVLASFVEPESGIEPHVGQRRGRQRRRIELEFEDFAASRAIGVEPPQS